MKNRNREEAVNTQLAIVISKLGVSANGETIQSAAHRPDVMFLMRGLRCIVEGKFADVAGADEEVAGDARARVEAGIAHIAAAVVYPKELRTTPTTAIENALESADLKYKLIYEYGETEWFSGSPASVMDGMRRVQQLLAGDDVVEKTASSLAAKLETVVNLWSGQAGTCDRLCGILGMAIPPRESAEERKARRDTASKVSALVLSNALIFQEQLSGADGRISTLSSLQRKDNLIEATAKHWNWIWKSINYVPIFQLGESILLELPSSPQTMEVFDSLLSEAKAICLNQAALRHDLMGRIYHWLLYQAKYLGTYYTSVSAATLLLKIAMREEWATKFSDPKELANFKVADLTCGTGTLLMAAAQSITDSYIRARSQNGLSLEKEDLQVLHKSLMENILHGYDVLPSAVHLTAATLAMLAPEVSFVKMNLFVMPFGLDNGKARLGSLDFLETSTAETQIALDNSQKEIVRASSAETHFSSAAIPKLDLCVMNPPFVRSVGGNLLFGSLPDERGLLQKELKKAVKKASAKGLLSNINAGLGSVFAAVADNHLKPNGRMAFVLPAAVVSGESWAETRKLISTRFDLETVFISHDVERPNFSENTSLSETMFIAKKRPAGATANPEPKRTTFINLWRNPRSIHEALDLAERISATPIVTIESGETSSIVSYAGKLGEAFSMPAPEGDHIWQGAMFAQTSTLRACLNLESGHTNSLKTSNSKSVSLCELKELGALGPDRKRVHEGFKVAEGEVTEYPALWGHDSKQNKTLSQSPTAYFKPWRQSPRGADYGDHLWQRAGRIQLVERLRTNTHRLVAVRLNEKVLGNTWWAFNSRLSVPKEKALVLWLNSSFGVLLMMGRRVVTEGAWMQLKQPAWESMPVLDVRGLTKEQEVALAKAYDTYCKQDLTSIANLANDPVRKKIDEAIADALGLEGVSFIQKVLSGEPGLTTNPAGYNSDLEKIEDASLDDHEEALNEALEVQQKRKKGRRPKRREISG